MNRLRVRYLFSLLSLSLLLGLAGLAVLWLTGSWPAGGWWLLPWGLCLLAVPLAAVWWLDQWVLRRLARLGSELEAIHDQHRWDANVTVDGNDEVTAVALHANRLLDRLGFQLDNLEALADTDELTGLANRRLFNEELERSLAASHRQGLPLCLVMLDVDHFKAYNDLYGHPQGDQALRTLAGLLRQQARRPRDLSARIGGEEFAVILEDTPLQGATRWVQSIQAALAERDLAHAHGADGQRLSFSAGVALAAPGDTPEALYLRADGALYRAKHAGRNRVMVAAEAPDADLRAA